MSYRQVPEKFLVAFSFAGEERELVRSVAQAVEKELDPPNVFFDEWFEHYTAGEDADITLQEIYGKRCELAVVCISGNYGKKPWTLAEHAAIRAREMESRVSDNEVDRLGVLPVRVGEGEVKGVLFNGITPYIHKRTVAEAAELILNRLYLIRPDLRKPEEGTPDWPEKPPPLSWPMADHSEARASFERLLTRATPWRFLPIRGPSETGKSHITRQMLSNALRLPGLACGRFDFKGTTDLDGEVRAFVQDLGVTPPSTGMRLNERLGHILDALKQVARPALLIFDTYEAAGEAQDWVGKQLLPSLVRCTWLRVVITGQRVPDNVGAIWEAETCPVVTLKLPRPPEWFDYGKRHRPGLTLADVETACRLADDKVTLLAQLLGPRR